MSVIIKTTLDIGWEPFAPEIWSNGEEEFSLSPNMDWDSFSPALRDSIMKPYWEHASTHYLGKGLEHGLYIDIITQVQKSYTKI